MKPFATHTFGKWILLGEHSVLRGHPALAFPLLSRRLELEYAPSASSFDVQFEGEHGSDFRLLFFGVIENAMSRLGMTQPVVGQFKLTSSLPVGTGLGASAALCGAVARWCSSQGWVRSDEVYEFARQLEDLFHGESSGVDLAVSLSAQGVRFVRGGERRTFKPGWWPKFYLSYSGIRGVTSDCVSKVKRMFDESPDKAVELDTRMASAVREAELALIKGHAEDGMQQLKHAIDLGRTCFVEWGLCPREVESHMLELERAGAIAVKPTGSGGGGYVLSLWAEDPPTSLKSLMVPVTSPLTHS